MLLYFFFTCFPFILLLKPLPLWATHMRILLPLCFWQQLFDFSSFSFTKPSFSNNVGSSNISMKTISLTSATTAEETDETRIMSVLDLPELALECILEKLSPSGLLSMAGVCTSLREKCVSDHLWERHMKQKWGGLIGPAAYREWQWFLASRNDLDSCKQGKQKGLLRLISMFWPSSWSSARSSKIDDDSRQRTPLPVDSVMSWYLALESGTFRFPAQVYNRENGHVGFMLSCYDAELSYDPRTDTFSARYPPHGRRPIATETGVSWERLRAPPVDTSPHDLHVSDCLYDLRPGDHIEIQWRRNKEFPYGWWYGVVGHLESCDGNENYCRCHHSDTVALEFHQYTPGSRWRRTTISRKDHREEGNEADGFYGGIRKLNNHAEISRWKQLWPTGVLE